MQKLFNIIAEISPPETGTIASAATESFWDPASIVLCTAGLCIGIVWLFWYDGFAALKKAPTRRHRRGFIFWPAAILTCWIVLMGALLAAIKTDAGSYLTHAVLEIILITAMLIIARKSFTRGFKGFGINGKHLIKDTPWAAINLLGTLPLILFGLWVTLTLGRLFKDSGFSLEVHQTLDILTGASVGLRILVVIFAALIVPVFEELLFRGFFQTALRSLSGSPWTGIVLTSIFFAILHPPTHIPALFMLSCGLGYAYERSGSLLRPILMHIFFNGFSVAMTLLMPQ
jgi:membrane protease YdiL (CAAX protease family)